MGEVEREGSTEELCVLMCSTYNIILGGRHVSGESTLVYKHWNEKGSSSTL